MKSKGTITKIDDTMLVNVPIGKRRPPPGEPWEAYLFVTRGKRLSRSVVLLSARTKPALQRKVAKYVRDAGVEPTPERFANGPLPTR